jgi:hypothetical protein
MALRICLLEKQTPFPYLHEITLPECKIEILMRSGNYTNNVAQITTFCLNSVIEIENRERLLLCYVQQQALPQRLMPQGSLHSNPDGSFSREFHVKFLDKVTLRHVSLQVLWSSLFTMVSPVFILTSIHKPHYVILVSDSMLIVMLDYPQEIQICSTGISHIA